MVERYWTIIKRDNVVWSKVHGFWIGKEPARFSVLILPLTIYMKFNGLFFFSFLALEIRTNQKTHLVGGCEVD